jgi:hypothetical protein
VIRAKYPDLLDDDRIFGLLMNPAPKSPISSAAANAVPG